MELFDRRKRRTGFAVAAGDSSIDGDSPAFFRCQRTEIQPPPWPRPLAAIRKAAFPASFLQSGLLVAKERSWVVVAASGRRTIGYAQVVKAEREASGCYFEEIAVRSRYRHQGVGRELVHQAALWMHELGFETIFAVALQDSDKLRRETWFESLGLVDSGWSAYRARLDDLVVRLDRR